MVIDHFLLLCLSFSDLFKASYTNLSTSEVLELTHMGKYFYKSEPLFLTWALSGWISEFAAI